MKLKEIQEYYHNLSDNQLHEVLDQNNNTGFLTEDLVKIVRSAQSEEGWSPAMTGDQFLAEMQAWAQNIKQNGQKE